MSEISKSWEIGFLKTHERLILGVFLLAVVLFLGNKALNYNVNRDKTKATTAEQALAIQQKTNDQLAAQVAQQQAQYNTMIAALTAQNQALMASISASNDILARQQAVDKALPIPDLAARWKTIVPLKDGDITANTTGISVTDQGARDTVNQLEKVPVLQDNVNKLNELNTNKDKQIDGLNQLETTKDKQLAGKDLEIKDQTTACNAEKSALKAAARKSKFRWFIAGTVTGFVARSIINSFSAAIL